MGLQRLLRRVDQDENKCEADGREVEKQGEFESGKRVGIGKERIRIGEEEKVEEKENFSFLVLDSEEKKQAIFTRSF